MRKYKKGLAVYIVLLVFTFVGVFLATGFILIPASAEGEDIESESMLGKLPNTAIRPEVPVSESEETKPPVISEDEYLELEGALDDNEENELYEEEPASEEPEEEPDQKPAAEKPSKPAKPAELPYYIRVNRQANCVTVYEKDADGDYTVPVKAMVCSVGMYDWTPVGVFKTSTKYAWRALYGNVYGQYAFRITGSILFHSVPYATKSKDDLEYEEYNKLGEAASLGCVRLSVEDAKWLIDHCPSGTVTEIYDSEDPGPLGKPQPAYIPLDSEYRGWDPTDPDPANPWLGADPVIYGAADRTYEQDTAIDLLEGVSAQDYRGRNLTVNVKGTVNTAAAGAYEIVYTAVDGNGHETSRTVVITIVKPAEKPAESEKPADTETPGSVSKPGGSTENPGGTSKPGGSTETPGGTSKPGGSTETSGGTSRPGGSTENPGGISKPGGSTETPGGTSRPGGSTETPGGAGKPGGSTETPGSVSKPGGSTETPGGAGKPGGSTETPGGAGKPGGSAETPGSTEAPSESEAPGESETPAGSETPGSEAAPDAGKSPGGSGTPAESQTPSERGETGGSE